MPIRYPLNYGLVAEIVTDESDRPPYVPPPVKDHEHAATCRCDRCQSKRATTR